ncbi:hypothetical protein PFISCL1PPCAC_21507, partial [Pristionchus fissidentatus]
QCLLLALPTEMIATLLSFLPECDLLSLRVCKRIDLIDAKASRQLHIDNVHIVVTSESTVATCSRYDERQACPFLERFRVYHAKTHYDKITVDIHALTADTKELIEACRDSSARFFKIRCELVSAEVADSVASIIADSFILDLLKRKSIVHLVLPCKYVSESGIVAILKGLAAGAIDLTSLVLHVETALATRALGSFAPRESIRRVPNGYGMVSEMVVCNFDSVGWNRKYRIIINPDVGLDDGYAQVSIYEYP